MVAQAQIQEGTHRESQQRERRVEGQDHDEHHAEMQRGECDG